MAQIEQHDDINSVWAEGFGAQKHQEKESLVAVMTAKELSIVWSSDPRYWKWTSIEDPISRKKLEVAELIEVCWLQVDGRYETKKLKGAGKYAVDFVVKLKDDLLTNGPVTLKLTPPNGSVQVHKEDLNTKPKNKLIGLRVGEFTHVPKNLHDPFVKFSLSGHDGTSWKKGLVVIGAVIYPC